MKEETSTDERSIIRVIIENVLSDAHGSRKLKYHLFSCFVIFVFYRK